MYVRIFHQYTDLTQLIAGITTTIVIITIAIILLGIAALFKMLSNWKKRSINIYEIPYDYAVPPLPPSITVTRIDSVIYDTISEDFFKDISLQQADAPSQTESPNGTVSLDVASDSRDAKLNSMEFDEDHTSEQRNENDTGIRMLENESYQPSLVSNIMLDPNPTYGTNVATAPEIETEENIAYQHNLYGLNITNGSKINDMEDSVELHSDNSSCAEEARSNGLSQKQTIPETSTSTVIIDIENSVELHSCSIHSGDEMEASEQRSISDLGIMTNEMESSTENDTGIRMFENESYQPSLVSSITLDQNPAYATNVATSPEIETA